MNDPRYPIGRFADPGPATGADRAARIRSIAELPALVRDAVRDLPAGAWTQSYRDGGWTVRQLVHHLPDSHVNAYVRTKLALTEERPTIRPYDENLWAALPDTETTDPELSLRLLEALHARWVALLTGVEDGAWARTWHHPEHGKIFTLDWLLAQYEWHGRHHLGHIRAALQNVSRG